MQRPHSRAGQARRPRRSRPYRGAGTVIATGSDAMLRLCRHARSGPRPGRLRTLGTETAPAPASPAYPPPPAYASPITSPSRPPSRPQHVLNTLPITSSMPYSRVHSPRPAWLVARGPTVGARCHAAARGEVWVGGGCQMI